MIIPIIEQVLKELMLELDCVLRLILPYVLKVFSDALIGIISLLSLRHQPGSYATERWV